MKKPDRLVFKQYLMNLTPDELCKWLKEYEDVKKVQVKHRINELKQGEVQAQLEVLAPITECPFCHSNNIVRNGTEHLMQRYRCSNCKSSFKATTNTFMEKGNFTWEVWVKLLQMTINTYSLDEIMDTLEKDHGLAGIDRKTVFLARHKLINALSLMPKPQLSGIIQVDETFFRENQKGTRTDKGKQLINVIPSIVEVRLPRYGYQPSRTGVMSPEYACVVCAVDNNGHAISVVTSMGRVEPKVFTDCFDEYFTNVTYLCSDGSPLYDNYCRLRSIAHYIRPSAFVKVLRQNGYTFGVRKPKDKGEDKRGIETDDDGNELVGTYKELILANLQIKVKKKISEI